MSGAGSDRARLEALIADELLDWPDTAGRFLGEQASRRYQEGGDTVRCPYADSRRGEPMNGAALAQVMGQWPVVLQQIRSHGGPTAAHAWRATCRLRWGPLWSEPPVAEPVAAVFKTVLGLQRPLTAWLLMHPGAAGRPLSELLDGDLGERLEAEGWLHGQVQVCAGPMRRIREAWEALEAPGEPADHPADVTPLWVSGLWMVLAHARSCVREDRVPADWAWTGEVPAEWPRVLRWLRARGPGRWVREVEVFDPAWVLHLWEGVPEPVAQLAKDCERADPDGLDAAFDRFLASVQAGAVRGDQPS